MTHPEHKYNHRLNTHIRLARGGYLYVFDLYDHDQLIGTRTTVRTRRTAPETTEYAREGRTFTTAQAFLRDYLGET